jgi:hypothetical protein
VAERSNHATSHASPPRHRGSGGLPRSPAGRPPSQGTQLATRIAETGAMELALIIAVALAVTILVLAITDPDR